MPTCGLLSKRSADFHRPFPYALRYGDYSQMLLLFHSPFLFGYCTYGRHKLLRFPQKTRPHVFRGFRYPTCCLLRRLSGSRVQLNRAIHNRPNFGTPTLRIQTNPIIQWLKLLRASRFHVKTIKSWPRGCRAPFRREANVLPPRDVGVFPVARDKYFPLPKVSAISNC